MLSSYSRRWRSSPRQGLFVRLSTRGYCRGWRHGGELGCLPKKHNSLWEDWNQPTLTLKNKQCFQVIVRSHIQFTSSEILNKKFKMGISFKGQKREQYSKQGRKKKTSWSPKVLNYFQSKPVFWAAEDKMEQMSLSKVNLLSNITPKILKVTWI